MTIKAVTFDIWDTIVHDDSDEAERKEKGLRSKREERRHQVWEALNAIEAIDLETVSLAYDVAEAGFVVTWKEGHINWTIDQRLRVVLNGLGRSVPGEVFSDLVERHGRMEVDIPPLVIAGVQDAIAELSTRYKLAIVSDAIVTPGSGLRELLDRYGVKQYFGGFAFSDEVGLSKPHRSMFDTAASQLGVGVDELVHIGDRDHNDVKGPHALGSKAILFTGSRPDDKDITTADAICTDYKELPGIVDRLATQ